jgi:uncharacterized small protein (DUF1192 family)
MKAPGLVPTSETRDRLLILPEAKPKRRWPMIAGVLLLAAWTAAVAGIGVYLWQRDEVSDRDAIIAQTEEANDGLTASLSSANEQIATLQTEIAATEAELEQAQTGLEVAQGTSIQGQSQVASLQAQLDASRAELRAAIGPPLHHGMHIGFIVGVNAAESRVVLDLGRWFTGRAARQAALADGSILPGGHLPDPRYLRNPDHSWRIVHVRFGTTVTLRHYQGADAPTVVSLTTLASIFDSARTADDKVRLDPFWVMVDDGELIEITQQRYTAP